MKQTRLTETDETYYEHPIAQHHVERSRQVNAHKINKYLDEINKRINEETIDGIDAATPYDNKAENDDTAAAFADAIWMDLFEEIGLTFDSDEHTEEYVDEARYLIRKSHENHGIYELGMCDQQPRWVIVASKAVTRERGDTTATIYNTNPKPRKLSSFYNE